MAGKDNFFQRLTRLFRSGPAIQRRIKGQDYKAFYDKSLVHSNLGYRGPAPFGKESSPFSVLGGYGILDRISRYSEFCFDAETLIYTTKGIFSIKELSEKYQNGERFQVFSYDHNQNSIVLADAHHPRLTKDGIKQKLVKIILDDEGNVTTTLDHKFLLRSGQYILASDLKPGMSLMPFHKKDITGSGYKHIYTINKEDNKHEWTPEHKIIAEHFLGRKLTQDEVVHHVDFNPSNNFPENLRVMTTLEHKAYHARLNNIHKRNKLNSKHSLWMKTNNPASKNISLEMIYDAAQQVDFNSTKVKEILHISHPTLMRVVRKAGFKKWNDFSGYRAELSLIRTAAQILEECQPLSLERLLTVKRCSTIYEAASTLQCTDNAIRRSLQKLDLETWSEFSGKERVYGSKHGSDSVCYDNDLTYQAICDKFKPGITAEELASSLNTTKNKVITRIQNQGFKFYSDWVNSFQNHKVKEVVFLEEEKQVYNVTVDKHHNLAVGSLLQSPIMSKDGKSTSRTHSMVICRQSEMEYNAIIGAALSVYADESCASDEKGKSFHVYSENPEIKKVLEEVFYDTLNVEFNLRPWIRNLCKYGDFFLYNEIVPDVGVISCTPIPVNEVEREEGFDLEDPYAIRFRWLTRGNKILENWQVTHLRILGNDLFLPYGSSILEPARRVFRQLTMMEDAMLVYRVVRCLHGDSKISTKTGHKSIKDIVPGDVVWSYDYKQDQCVLSEITDVVNNGTQQIWEVISDHRKICGNDNHPLLVKDSETGLVDYVQIKDLVVNKHLLCKPKHSGLENKKTPIGSCFEASDEIKKSFLLGFADADGHIRKQSKTISYEIELCNKSLTEDLKSLCHQLGWNVSCKIKERTRKSRIINGNLPVKSHTTSYSLYFTQKKGQTFEKIRKVVKTDVFADVFDIRTNNDLHNFIADGVVVHNSPERRVFYIDVGNTAPNDIPGYMEAAKAALRSNTQVDKTNGRMDYRYNPVAVDEDYFIPVRGEAGGTKIETLAGGQHVSATEDVEYLQNKLFAALQIPRAYLTYDDSLSSKATLSQEDVRFSRTINIIQKIVIAEMNKLAMLHLYSKGFDGEDLINFELFLSNPSSVAVQQKLALWNDRADIAGKFKENGLVSEEWIQSEILGFTPEDMDKSKHARKEDLLYQKELEAIAVSSENQERQATVDPFDQSNYMVPGADVKKLPQDAEPGVSDNELVSGIAKFDSEGGLIRTETPPGQTPIQATPYATRRRRNDKRRVGQGGRDKLANPDFAEMTNMSGSHQYNSDIDDLESIRRKRNENKELEVLLRRSPKLSKEVKSMFHKMETRLNFTRKPKLIAENLEERLDKELNPTILESSNKDELLELLEAELNENNTSLQEQEIDLELTDDDESPENDENPDKDD